MSGTPFIINGNKSKVNSLIDWDKLGKTSDWHENVACKMLCEDFLVVIPSDGISISHIVIHTNIYPAKHFLSLNRFLSAFNLNLATLDTRYILLLVLTNILQDGWIYVVWRKSLMNFINIFIFLLYIYI